MAKRHRTAFGEETLLIQKTIFFFFKRLVRRRNAVEPRDKPLADIVSSPSHPVRSLPEERERGKERQREGKRAKHG